MNRKDGGKEGRTREDEGGHPQLEPGRKLPGTGARRRQARLEARRNGGREGVIFGVFWGKKRKKEG